MSVITIVVLSARGYAQTSRSTSVRTPLATPAIGQTLLQNSGWSPESDWPRVYIKDVAVRDAARQALRGASEWLEVPRCQSVASEFLDKQGRPLTERLSALNISVQGFLHLLILMDGESHPQCREEGVLAFTATDSRIVYLCGGAFERAWRRKPQEVRATIIHEMLHSLGLGERPPSARHITDRVQRLCW